MRQVKLRCLSDGPQMFPKMSKKRKLDADESSFDERREGEYMFVLQGGKKRERALACSRAPRQSSGSKSASLRLLVAIFCLQRDETCAVGKAKAQMLKATLGPTGGGARRDRPPMLHDKSRGEKKAEAFMGRRQPYIDRTSSRASCCQPCCKSPFGKIYWTRRLVLPQAHDGRPDKSPA
ncbi:uncharacterized protein LOC133496039 isoform X2 [Syngnathoides biaculeatus]|uniref:uncharacterized protein LOC133496039 isoform X2 n=1 Tax=Syngnathoides biaculeatus TaxID=300417 RepID=UPI002ADE5AB9|nr:uncharacterized protein LOC133496039 isoform X2 [Syngnathoides biaculeatus]